jgi:phosphinothricin acetyltransferase
MNCTFSEVKEEHLPALAGILNHYVLNSTVTFHKELLTPADMAAKVFFDQPWYRAFIIELDGNIIGYCAVSLWKKQEAYRHTAEINIYLLPEHTGKGIGSTAVQHLEDFARNNDIHNLIAGLCSENTPSRRLFEKNGYTHCATFKQVGTKFGRVLDTIYLQKQLN